MENAMILLYDICRLCLDEPGMDNIFKPVDMSQDIFTFTGIKVTTSDQLPQTICTSCRDIINCVKVLKDIANLNDNHLKAIRGNNDENGCNQKESCDPSKITSSSVNKSFKSRIIYEGDTDKFKSKTEKLNKKKRKYSSKPETITNATKMISVRKDLFDCSTTVTSASLQHIKSSPNKDFTSNECSEKERKGDENAVASSKTVTSSTKKCIPFSTPTSSPNKDPEKTVKVGDTTLKVFKFEHQCETCNKTYSTPKKLYLHQLAHNKKFICPLDACDDEYKMIDLNGRKIVLYNNYTFSRHGGRNYYCSQKSSMSCKAKIHFDKNYKMKHVFNEHKHRPPVLHVTSFGKYLKID